MNELEASEYADSYMGWIEESRMNSLSESEKFDAQLHRYADDVLYLAIKLHMDIAMIPMTRDDAHDYVWDIKEDVRNTIRRTKEVINESRDEGRDL